MAITLNDLLTLNTDSDSIKNLIPDSSTELWWHANLRRPDQTKQKEYVKRMTKLRMLWCWTVIVMMARLIQIINSCWMTRMNGWLTVPVPVRT